MERSTKINVYQTAYEQLKKDERITGLGYPSEKENYDFYFDVSGLHVDFSLSDEVDLLQIQTKYDYKGMNDEDLERIAQKIKNPNNVRISYFDEAIRMELAIPLFGKSEQDAFREVIKCVWDFVNFVQNNADMLKSYDVPKFNHKAEAPETKKENEKNKEDIPFVREKDKEEKRAISKTEGLLKMEKVSEPGSEFKENEKLDKSKQVSKVEPMNSESERKEIVKMENKKETGVETMAEKYAAPVAEQMRKMYAELSGVFQDRKSQLDEREETLQKIEESFSSREQELKAKTEKYKKLLEEWDIKEAELNAKEMAIQEKEKTVLNREKDFETKKSYLKGLEARIKETDTGALQGQISDLRRTLNETKSERDHLLQETNALKEEIVEKNKSISEMLVVAGSSAGFEEDMKKLQAKMEYQNTVYNEKLKENEEKIAKAKEFAQMKQREAEELHQLLEEKQKEIEEMEILLEEEKKETEDVAEILESMGLNYEVEENGEIFADSDGGIQYYIRPDLHMIQAGKDLSRSGKKKMLKLVPQWNEEEKEEDLFAIYKLKNNRVECQITYADLKSALDEIKKNFE